MKNIDTTTLKHAVPGTVDMIKKCLKVGCSTSHALDIVSAAHGIKDYNTAKGLSKNTPTPTTYDNASLASLSRALDEAKQLTVDMVHYEKISTRLVRRLLALLNTLAAEARCPDEIDVDMPTDRFTAYLRHQVEQAIQDNTFSFSMNGADTADTNFSGLSKFVVDASITFGEHVLDLRLEYKTSEYEGREEESLDITFDGGTLEDHLEMEPSPTGEYAIDIFNEHFMALMFDVFDQQTPDVNDPASPMFAQRHRVLAAVAQCL